MEGAHVVPTVTVAVGDGFPVALPRDRELLVSRNEIAGRFVISPLTDFDHVVPLGPALARPRTLVVR